MIAADFVVLENVPLAPLTTLGVGGPTRYYAWAGSPNAVASAVQWAADHAVPVLVLGGGSNMLVGDAGYPGMVLRVAIDEITAHASDGAMQVRAGAGAAWSSLVACAVAQNWAGVECLAGIPGLVGATPIQNVGAYGQEVRETISDVEALDLITGDIVHFSNSACHFGYRSSRFKQHDRGRYIILTVQFRLRPGGMPNVRYIELERMLHARQLSRPTLTDVQRAVLDIRRSKSMLLDPSDPNTVSAGSFFLNPFLTPEDYARFEAVAAPTLPPGERIAHYQGEDGLIKVPAAWLIEHAGFTRGYTRGPVGLSANHTLAIVNRGSATARDVIALAREIRDRVRDRFGITLIPEPTLVGVSLDDDSWLNAK